MSNLLTDILGNIGKDTILEAGRNSGLSKESTENFSTDALELLLGGLAKNAQNKTESEKILEVLKNDHLENLENKGGILSGDLDKNGSGILKHVFGNKEEKILKELSVKNGTDKESGKNFLELLAPLFMGGLAKTTNKTNMDSDILSKVLDMASKSDAAKNGKTGGLLSLLDLDKDGKIIDDLPKLFAMATAAWKFISRFLGKK